MEKHNDIGAVILPNMNKVNIVDPFSFLTSNQQVIDQLNIDHPITLKYNKDLVERIHQRYPLITKYEVAVIVRAVFSSFRELLVSGNVMNFNCLFFDVKLKFFKHRRAGRILPALKVHIGTPPALRQKI